MYTNSIADAAEDFGLEDERSVDVIIYKSFFRCHGGAKRHWPTAMRYMIFSSSILGYPSKRRWEDSDTGSSWTQLKRGIRKICARHLAEVLTLRTTSNLPTVVVVKRPSTKARRQRVSWHAPISSIQYWDVQYRSNGNILMMNLNSFDGVGVGVSMIDLTRFVTLAASKTRYSKDLLRQNFFVRVRIESKRLVGFLPTSKFQSNSQLA
jgi:hypothetical protein